MAIIYHKDLSGADLHDPKEHANEAHSGAYIETCNKHTKNDHDALALDHGALSGKADDDHDQYYNATRHTKAIHDSLNINGDKVDGCDAGIATGNVFKLPAGLTHGDIFYVNSSGNVLRLGYGTSGHFLKTQGAGANPIWAEGGGGVTDHGALTGLEDDDHSQYYNSARHTKAIHDSLNINAGQVDGCDAGVATGKVFKLPASLAHGDIFYVNSSGNVVRLGAGTSGYFLKTYGPGVNPVWAEGAGGGITDHGELTGLNDDDHSQYYNLARHTKTVHDSLNINAGQVDGCDAGVATGNVFKLPVSLTHGDIFYVASGGNAVRLGAGTSGYFLKTQGSGTNPIWTAHTKSVHDGLALDHGALSGRTDDDHSQYYNSARHTKAIHDSLGIAPASHGADKHTNITRTIFVGAGAGCGTGVLGAVGNWGIAQFDSDTDQYWTFKFQLPQDYSTSGTIKILYLEHGVATGNIVWDAYLNHAQPGEAFGSNSSNDIGNIQAIAASSLLQSITTALTLTSPTKGEYIAIKINRDADNASDTYTSTWRVVGIVFEYTADQ